MVAGCAGRTGEPGITGVSTVCFNVENLMLYARSEMIGFAGNERYGVLEE